MDWFRNCIHSHQEKCVTPVFQTKHGEGGNCWQAATASILGLDLDEVPDFVQQENPDEAYLDFLQSQGFICAKLQPSSWDCYYLAFGPSIVTGRKHVVVARNNKLVHDPHQGRNGLRNVEYINLIIPIEIDLS